MKGENITPAKTGSANSFINARKVYRERREAFCFEVMGEHNSVIFINDAASLSVEETKHSLESICSPTLLITGGGNCDAEYEGLGNSIQAKVKAVVFLGSEMKSIINSCVGMQTLFVTADSIAEALEYAVILSKPGDAIIYSPACSSSSIGGLVGGKESEQMEYRKRGLEFKKAVKKIFSKR